MAIGIRLEPSKRIPAKPPAILRSTGTHLMKTGTPNSESIMTPALITNTAFPKNVLPNPIKRSRVRKPKKILPKPSTRRGNHIARGDS